MVNAGGKFKSGLYRVRDTNGDDRLDKVELLRESRATASTARTPSSSAPTASRSTSSPATRPGRSSSTARWCRANWGEDQLLPRDARRHAASCATRPPRAAASTGSTPTASTGSWCRWAIATPTTSPSTATATCSPTTPTWSGTSTLPWYRPTRVCHAVSGSRVRLARRLGQVADLLPRQPAPDGQRRPRLAHRRDLRLRRQVPGEVPGGPVSLRLELRQALRRPPDARRARPTRASSRSSSPARRCPLTDIVVNPNDGAMYFTIGGRQDHVGPLPRDLRRAANRRPRARPITRGAEARGHAPHARSIPRPRRPEAVATAWPYLGHPDRFIRYAARVAIEWQDPATWQERALSETDAPAALTALLALARQGDRSLQGRLLEALDRLDWERLTDSAEARPAARLQPGLHPDGRPRRRHGRAHDRAVRPPLPGPGPDAERRALQDARLPEGARRRRQDAGPAGRGADPGGADRLRPRPAGLEDRLDPPSCASAYFSWFVKAADYRGGASFELFLKHIKEDGDREPERAREGRAQADPRRRAAGSSRRWRSRPTARSSRPGRSTSWPRSSRRD